MQDLTGSPLPDGWRAVSRRTLNLWPSEPGYGNLSLDPDYLRNFFHSANDRAKGWNMCGYNNPEFDRIADESARVMDMEKRKVLIWKMQKIIMRDLPYLPLYNPKLVEAVRRDRFEGWVNMLGGIGNTWSFCRLRAK